MARTGRLAPRAIAGTGMLDPGAAAPTEPDDPPASALPTPVVSAAPPAVVALTAAPEAPDEPPADEAAGSPPQPAAPADGPDPRSRTARSTSARLQVTVMVTADVRDRFDLWRDDHKLSNTAVAAMALNAGDGHYAALVMARRPQAQPGTRFGVPVPGRRMSTQRSRSVQLSLYLLPAELDDIDGIVNGVPDANRSELLDAVLDEFLPPMARLKRSARRTAS